VFENSAHLAMAEEPEHFRDAVETFLAQVEAAAHGPGAEVTG
jgi:hypothetical protein